MLRLLDVSVVRAAVTALTLAMCSSGAFAAKKDHSAGKEAVEKFLLSKYVVTPFNLGRGPSPPGVVVQLMKPGLESAPATALAPIFSYKEGRIRRAIVTLAMKDLAPLPYQTRLYITKIDAKDNYVLVDLVTTEAFDGAWFRSALHIEMGKTYLESPDVKNIDATIAEVLMIERPEPPQRPPYRQPTGGGGGYDNPLPQRNPVPTRIEDPPPPPAPPRPTVQEPPPPPPPPPPAAIEINPGMTADQVKKALGQPTSSNKLGTKEILVYQKMKVTLINGRVTDVQ